MSNTVTSTNESTSRAQKPLSHLGAKEINSRTDINDKPSIAPFSQVLESSALLNMDKEQVSTPQKKIQQDVKEKPTNTKLRHQEQSGNNLPQEDIQNRQGDSFEDKKKGVSEESETSFKKDKSTYTEKSPLEVKNSEVDSPVAPELKQDHAVTTQPQLVHVEAESEKTIDQTNPVADIAATSTEANRVNVTNEKSTDGIKLDSEKDQKSLLDLMQSFRSWKKLYYGTAQQSATNSLQNNTTTSLINQTEVNSSLHSWFSQQSLLNSKTTLSSESKTLHELKGTTTQGATNNLNVLSNGHAVLGASLQTKPASSIPTIQMSAALTTAAGQQEFAQQLTLMVQNNLKQAQLHINPRHLGPIEVNIQLNQDQQVNVAFNVSNTGAKDAIDSAIHRLKELFDQHDLNLSHVETKYASDKDNNQHRDQKDSSSTSARQNELRVGESDLEDQTAKKFVSNHNGLIDDFA